MSDEKINTRFAIGDIVRIVRICPTVAGADFAEAAETCLQEYENSLTKEFVVIDVDNYIPVTYTLGNDGEDSFFEQELDWA